MSVDVVFELGNGEAQTIEAQARLDTQAELRYFREGGILPAVVRDISRGR